MQLSVLFGQFFLKVNCESNQQTYLRQLRRIYKRHLLGVEHVLHIVGSKVARGRSNPEELRVKVLSMGKTHKCALGSSFRQMFECSCIT